MGKCIDQFSGGIDFAVYPNASVTLHRSSNPVLLTLHLERQHHFPPGCPQSVELYMYAGQQGSFQQHRFESNSRLSWQTHLDSLHRSESDAMYVPIYSVTSVQSILSDQINTGIDKCFIKGMHGFSTSMVG